MLINHTKTINASKMVNARISSDVYEKAMSIVNSKSDYSIADLVRDALAREIGRHSKSKDVPPASLDDITFLVYQLVGEGYSRQVDELIKADSDKTFNVASFIRVAIENEVSRRLLCKPVRQITLNDVSDQIRHLANQLEERSLNDRKSHLLLESLALAMGLDPNKRSV